MKPWNVVELMYVSCYVTALFFVVATLSPRQATFILVGVHTANDVVFADSKTQIKSYVFDVVRAIVPRINLDDVFTVMEMAHLWLPTSFPACMDACMISYLQQ